LAFSGVRWGLTQIFTLYTSNVVHFVNLLTLAYEVHRSIMSLQLINWLWWTPDLVSVWMGDCLQAGKTSTYITSHSGPSHLSLAIPSWVCAMSASEGWSIE